MMIKTALMALMGLAAVTEASRIPARHELLSRQNRGNRNGGNNNNNNNNAGNAANTNTGNNNAASETCLNANAVQTGSASTGQDGADVQAGQVNSATDTANFINFCSGETLTNGLQNTDGSCNGIVMGKIPAKANMVSTVIINPPLGETVQANTDFNVTVQIANMQLGSFTNAQETYYSAPQDLNGQGQIIGHCHITIQDIGNTLTPQTPPDATQFAFFKGINDAGNGQGQLTTAVTGGLPAGNYRICTLNGASNHQPVLMPVAQRGGQDDCIRVVVGDTGNNNNNNNNNNNANAGNNNANAGNANNAAAGNNNANAGNANNNAGNAAGNAGGNRGQGRGGQAQGNTGSASASTGANGNNGSKATSAVETATATNSAASAATTSAAASNGATGGNNNAAAGGAIGGIAAPAVEDSGDKTRPFSVNGDTFVNKGAAVQRACAIQNNKCADAVNSGQVTGQTVGDCNAQEQTCNAAGGA